MLSSIEITYLMEKHKILSTDACAPKTLVWHHTSAKHHHNAYLLEMPQSLVSDPVQRKCSHEKRRCDQALTTHTLWKCHHRSRPTPVQRKRSHDITQVQKGQSRASATYCEPAVQLSIPSDFGSGLREIGRTRFEAKPLWQNPFSHGYRAIKYNTRV